MASTLIFCEDIKSREKQTEEAWKGEASGWITKCSLTTFQQRRLASIFPAALRKLNRSLSVTWLILPAKLQGRSCDFTSKSYGDVSPQKPEQSGQPPRICVSRHSECLQNMLRTFNEDIIIRNIVVLLPFVPNPPPTLSYHFS